MSTLLALFQADGIIETITSVIGTFLYPLFSIIYLCIGGIQQLFYKFAGIETMAYAGQSISNGNSGEENDTGIIYYLMNNTLVRNMLMSIMLLALFLVVIFTVMAFIKNVYSAKPKNWKDIIGNAIKGLANFIFLPVCCLLGIWLGNILLQAINGATSNGGSTSMDRKLFIACSYNANVFRCADSPNITWAQLVELTNNKMLDKNKTFAEEYGLTFTESDELVITASSSDEDREYYAGLVDQIYSETSVGIIWYGDVWTFYSLWNVNYVVMVVGGIFMLYVLGSLAFAMVRRLFLILLLFIISPGVCALYPLDEGKAVGSWKSKFIEQVLSAYGAVAGLNIFFSLMPLIDRIELGANWFQLNEIAQIFILVVGLMVVKEFISLISGFVGGEDSYGKGTGLMSNAKNKVLSSTKKASKFAGTVAPFVGGAARSVWNITKGAARTARDGANWAGDKAGELVDKAKNSRFAKAIETEKLHKLARKEGYGVGKGKDFKYIEGMPGSIEDADEFMRALADDNKSGKLMKRQEKRDARKARGARNKQLLSDALSDVGTFFEPVTSKVKAAGGKVASGAKKAGKAIKDSELGKAIVEEAKKLPGGLKGIASAIYEESGLKKQAGEISAEYLGATDRQAIRDKLQTDGRLGEHKIIKALNDMADSNDHIESMSTSVINTLGEAFGEAIAKRFFGGKLGEEIKSARDHLGLDKTSKTSDLAHLDSVLQRLQHYADRINESKGGAREEYIKGAIEYARDTDAKGNSQLQEALNQAFAKFSEDGIKVDGEVKFDGDSLVSSMTKASKDVGKAMAKEMKESFKTLMDDIDKENRKKK